MSSLTKIRENNTSRLIGSPVESGKTQFDNKVQMPKVVDVSGTVTLVNMKSPNGENQLRDYRSIRDSLYKMFHDRSYNTYTIVCKHNVIRNMICESLEIDNTTDKYDVADVSITFKELMIAEAMYKNTKPIRPDNLPTKDSGDKAISPMASYLSATGGILSLR